MKLSKNYIYYYIKIGIVLLLLLIILYYLYSLTIIKKQQNTVKDLFNKSKIPTGTKTAMITGGSSGIGYAYCNALLECGYNIVIVDVNKNIETIVSKLKTKFTKSGVNIYGIEADVGNFDSMAKAFTTASTHASNGILDVIILNAGIDLPIYKNDHKIIQTNLLGPMYGIELYVKQITKGLTTKVPKDKNLQIIITGSLASFIPIDMNLSPAYDASKAAIGQLVRSYRPIARRYNFRINAVCPTGLVETNLTKHHIDTKVKRLQVLAYQSSEGRGGILQPEQIVPGLLEVITNKKYNGDLIAVNPNLGYLYRLEPRDENNSFIEYGIYDESKSIATKTILDYRINTEYLGKK
jgi:NAD(P)-dependent dehydrogenase (short-subunit alcohol dehydrogenase family)